MSHRNHPVNKPVGICIEYLRISGVLMALWVVHPYIVESSSRRCDVQAPKAVSRIGGAGGQVPYAVLLKLAEDRPNGQNWTCAQLGTPDFGHNATGGHNVTAVMLYIGKRNRHMYLSYAIRIGERDHEAGATECWQKVEAVT